MFKFLGTALGVALILAGMGFASATILVLLNSFVEWQWVGYNWPLTRAVVGVFFLIGLAVGLIAASDR